MSVAKMCQKSRGAVSILEEWQQGHFFVQGKSATIA